MKSCHSEFPANYLENLIGRCPNVVFLSDSHCAWLSAATGVQDLRWVGQGVDLALRASLTGTRILLCWLICRLPSLPHWPGAGPSTVTDAQRLYRRLLDPVLKCRVWAAGGPAVDVGGGEDRMERVCQGEVMGSRQVVGSVRPGNASWWLANQSSPV